MPRRRAWLPLCSAAEEGVGAKRPARGEIGPQIACGAVCRPAVVAGGHRMWVAGKGLRPTRARGDQAPRAPRSGQTACRWPLESAATSSSLASRGAASR